MLFPSLGAPAKLCKICSTYVPLFCGISLYIIPKPYVPPVKVVP
jgi:hypothetical protein